LIFHFFANFIVKVVFIGVFLKIYKNKEVSQREEEDKKAREREREKEKENM